MIGCRLRPITSSMFVLIFSTLRQVSVKVFRIPPSGLTLRAGAGMVAEIAVIGVLPSSSRVPLSSSLWRGGR